LYRKGAESKTEKNKKTNNQKVKWINTANPFKCIKNIIICFFITHKDKKAAYDKEPGNGNF
jgi:hypothetical protein